MSGQKPARRRPGASPDREPDFAARLARAEFGRHYVDPLRFEQILKDGAVVLSDRASKGRSDGH